MHQLTKELINFDSPDWIKNYNDVAWSNPNLQNLVASVSLKTPKTYFPPTPILSTNKQPITILALDLGMKNNQIRCFINRGVQLKVVPFDYDFLNEEFDGLFLSNGPGDPSILDGLIKKLRTFMDRKTRPIFGICLGHQIMALAAGAETEKLLFGISVLT